MAVTGLDKVFVVNADTNTKYGGVDPTGSFQTIDELRGYKVYTALITQSGESDPQSQSSGAVEQGVTYQILFSKPEDPWDFSNVGGPKYPENWSFVATSNDVPKEYGTATLNYDTGAPVVTVLENTIGNISFAFNTDGLYEINSTGLFIEDKTFLLSTAFTALNSDVTAMTIFNQIDTSTIGIIVGENGFLNGVPIEIRVYN